MSMDVEHAEMVVKAQDEAKKRGEPDPGPRAPSLAIWSPEVDVGYKILDATHAVAYAVAKSNGGTNVKPPKPALRPSNAMEAARLRMKAEAHERIKARVLPKRPTTE